MTQTDFSHATRRACALGLAALVALCLCACAGRAQDSLMPAQPDMSVDAATRAQVIEGALRELAAAYVYPEVAQTMAKSIRARVANKEYDAITSATELARKLTTDLQAISHDKHLRVAYRAEGFDGGVRLMPPDPTGKRGLEKVERLPGNIGYLQFSFFAGLDAVRERVSAAMQELSDTDALVIDVRHCRGGAGQTIAFLMSYLFNGRVHLNDIYDRPSDTTMEDWTSADVPGRRYLEKDVYVLTDGGTFSAAEALGYTLQNLKRATIVGAVTGGGAHPVMPRRLDAHFFVTVPFARYVGIGTKSNWEGVGVQPDLKVPAAQALTVAQLAALKKIAAQTTAGARAAQLKERIETLEKELATQKESEQKAKS